ncbi:hypothetical protein KJ359_004481 [Pestalotiopsis sp. 9143b]|nr:hypothetical protein KJ359_004481 [Pestalotiopsis sp. 9143b]
MAQLASPAALTTENLKALSPSSFSHSYYPASVSSSREEEDDDSASLFSDSHSIVSSTSTAPEDEAAPFTVQEPSTGETVTVYESLEQAVRYSLLRAEQERRREEETMRFAYGGGGAASSQPQEVVLMSSDSWASAPAGYGQAGGADDSEVDEDAYFSMG